MSNTFPSDFEEFIYTSRYARWIESEGRREQWHETVARYVGFMRSHATEFGKDNSFEWDKIERAIINFDVMPSMRALMTAGPALARDNTAGYNCAFNVVDDPKVFDEAMQILLCGTGVGFSVEEKYIRKLPEIPDELFDSETTIVVRDSKEGWAKALRQLIALLYSGEIPKYNLSKVRPAGARLKTFGGRASGPGPLNELFLFVINVFKNASGRRLNSLECHDIMCKIGKVVVSGGVRRSAMISLSDLGDDRMRHAKSGQWWENNQQRSLANNSAVYKDKPDCETFMREWLSLVESKSGERGIFNRLASHKQVQANGRREENYEWGTNPCSEIILRGPRRGSNGEFVVGTGGQFCNLSEAVVRSGDTLEDLKEKVRIATIIGTLQSTLTHFPYLRKSWQRNTEEERLLGVSLTGIMDHTVLANTVDSARWLEELREVAVSTNSEYAAHLGIPPSAAITCVKPSGTVSQLVDAASGIHTRHSPFYIRTVRGDKKDALTQFMIDAGIPAEDDVTNPDNTVVFSFPKKAPQNAICRHDKSAIQQLELWLIYQRHWCEHKPSVTISVRDEEWLEVGAWVYKHFDELSGISFLPFSDHSYEQAPYQDCSEDQYAEMLNLMPGKINWSNLSDYEHEDNTVSSQTLACTGSVCEVVDISN